MAQNKLNPKQEFFCKEYLIDLNGTQAAIRAGYSKKTAGSIGEQLLKKLEVQTRISELKAKRAEKLEITADMVLRELAKIGFSNFKNYLDESNDLKSIHDMPDDVSACISEIKTTEITIDGVTTSKKQIKLHDKLAALDKIGRHIGFFEKDNDPQGKTIKVTFSKK